MYVHFNLLCGRETQIRLLGLFRQRIREWTELGLISRAVTSFHFNSPPNPSDSLYICLDIPAADSLEQIPARIIQYMDKICHEHNVKLNTRDYRSEIEQAKKNEEQKGASYYGNAPVEEILRFASAGTSIAFEVLERLEKGVIRNDEQLSRLILLRLSEEFGSDYGWILEALHFVCNPLLIPRNMENVIVFPKLGYAAVERVRAAQKSVT